MSKSLPPEKVCPLNPHEVFCPNSDCPNRGLIDQGNIRIHSQTDRRFLCATCHRTFAATKGTPFYRLHLAAGLMNIVLILLSFGCPVQAVVAALGLDERTVQQWAKTAGQHGEQIHIHLIETARVTDEVVQADEIGVKVVGRKVWQAMAMTAESRLWLGGVISPTRDRALIDALVMKIDACLADKAVTICVDGFASYLTSIGRVFREKVKPAVPRPGAWRKIGIVGLRIGQVVKRYTGKCVSSVEERAIGGTVAEIRAHLQARGVGQHIHTAFIERINATFRAHWAGLTRRGRAIVHTTCMATAGMWLVGSCYNWCWPHDSLRVESEGSERKWQERTPAMAAGVTDHIWSMEELLRYKVPLEVWTPPKRRGRKPKLQVAAQMPKRPRGRPKKVDDPSRQAVKK
jgi:transposase-like protein